MRLDFTNNTTGISVSRCIADCNDNGVADEFDRLGCPDVDCDGTVNVLDLIAVIVNFGESGDQDADINNDGTVNVSDLLAIIVNWGETCD